MKAQRLAEYRAKKACQGPGPAAKSSVLIDVKPWDNETDLAEMERQVRAIQMDGLFVGGSQLVPIGYGIQKLQINCVVEDDKVGTDMLGGSHLRFGRFGPIHRYCRFQQDLNSAAKNEKGNEVFE